MKNQSQLIKLTCTGCIIQFAVIANVFAINDNQYISTVNIPGSFELFSEELAAPVYLSNNEINQGTMYLSFGPLILPWFCNALL